MFADPQSVTVNSVAQSLPAIAREANASVYQKDDATYKLTISHLQGQSQPFHGPSRCQQGGCRPARFGEQSGLQSVGVPRDGQARGRVFQFGMPAHGVWSHRVAFIRQPSQGPWWRDLKGL